MKRSLDPAQPPAPEPQLGDRQTVPFFLRGEAAESVTPSPDQGRGTEASPLHEFVARGQAAQRAVDEALASIAAGNVARGTPDSAISREQLYYRERPSRKR